MQMRQMRTMIAVAVVATVTGGAVATAQESLPLVDRFGPQVGETVPDFSLVDQFGEPRTLQSLMGPNGLMLVFSRSADW
jgi:cytochrome oxidase Cu insertion factor (SCO1/SenC/PrrC family)